jgi:hypothetical protein
MYRIMINRDRRNNTQSSGSPTRSIKRSTSFSLIFILCLLLDFTSASKSSLPLLPPSTVVTVAPTQSTKPQSAKPNLFRNLRQRLQLNKLQFDSEGDVSPLGDVLMVSLRWTLMGCAGFELFDVMKDLIQETKEESASAGGGGSGTLISKSNTKRLLTWMADPNPDKKPLPPQVPIMSPQIALQQRTSGVPLFSSSSNASAPSVADTLPRLTKPQACLLTDCLLAPDPSVTLKRVSGSIQIRQALRNWIRRINSDSNSKNHLENNPHAKFVAAQNQQGIVLHGPPGCGKLLLIQAFCGKFRRPTSVTAPSTIKSKCIGESNQRVKMSWILVDVFQNHCALVLDELDGLFRERDDQEHEVSRDVKTEFLQLWDGVLSQEGQALVDLRSLDLLDKILLVLLESFFFCP